MEAWTKGKIDDKDEILIILKFNKGKGKEENRSTSYVTSGPACAN